MSGAVLSSTLPLLPTPPFGRYGQAASPYLRSVPFHRVYTQLRSGVRVRGGHRRNLGTGFGVVRVLVLRGRSNKGASVVVWKGS